jgi:hypothetical protein
VDEGGESVELSGFCRWWQRPGVRRALTALMAAAALAVALSATQRALYGSSEFMGFHQIVQVGVVRNRDHYRAIPHIRAYPPFFAIFWTPFGAIPIGLMSEREKLPAGATLGQQLQLGASAAVAALLMAAFTYWAVRCIADACRPAGAERPSSCLPALIYLLAGGLMLNSVVRIETDMLVVMLVAGAMYLTFVRERHWDGGALLGVAAALKLTPALFGVYLLCRRNWRGAAGMLAAGFVCSVVLPVMVWGFDGSYQRTRSWFEEVLSPVVTEGPHFIGQAYRSANQSLHAAAVRYLTHYDVAGGRRERFVNVADLPPEAVSTLVNVVRIAVLALLVVAWLLPPRVADRELELVLFALAPPAMLLLSDVSVSGHFAVAAVPLGVLAAHCLRHAGEPLSRRLSWWTLAGALLMSLMALRQLKELSVATAGALLIYGVGLWLGRLLSCRHSAASCDRALRQCARPRGAPATPRGE